MKTTPRFRDSWFVQAGTGIVALSAVPFGLVILIGLVLRKNTEVGPTFLWLVLGAGFGFLCVVLGCLGVLKRRMSHVTKSQ